MLLRKLGQPVNIRNYFVFIQTLMQISEKMTRTEMRATVSLASIYGCAYHCHGFGAMLLARRIGY